MIVVAAVLFSAALFSVLAQAHHQHFVPRASKTLPPVNVP
jgi:hypothetical protein